MSDKKHIEYCIKLGNKLLQDKLGENSESEFDRLYNNYNYQSSSYDEKRHESYTPPKRDEKMLDFRKRLQNWNQ